MYKLKCEECKNTFNHQQGNTKACSEECRKKREIKRFGRFSDKSISCGTVGAIAELETSSDLMSKGYSVFRALSPACFCDLIAFKDNKLFRVEVKTGYMSDVNGKITNPITKKENYDILSIYIRQKNKCFFRDNTGNDLTL